MLSRRQFFTITVIMCVIFVMFQVTSVLKDAWNEYDKNDYEVNSASNLNGDGNYEIKQSILNSLESDSYVIFIGDSEEDTTGQMAKLWCEYQKIDCFSYPSLSNVPKKILNKAKFLLLDSKFLDIENDTKKLTSLAKEGMSMIFCNIPDVQTIRKNKELQTLLGIYSIMQEDVELEGIELFEDFLLGGRSLYQVTNEEEEKQQDLNLNIPWYVTYSGVKRYMVGLVDKEPYGGEESLKDESLPTIIWRNSIEEAKIFVVNGDYMEDVTALGIYSAMFYEMSDYVLYPIVNAQSLSVANFAAFSSEEDEKMMELYSRKQKVFFQDLIWPSLVTVCKQSENIPTFFITSKLDYTSFEEPDESKLIYFQKLFKEIDAESGWSLHQISQIPLTQKVDADQTFFNKNIANYVFTSLYIDADMQSSVPDLKLDNIRTICMNTDKTQAPISYLTDEVTKQYATENGFEHTYSDNMRLKSLETALGYSNILLDLESILIPKTQDEQWEKQEEQFASYTMTYWKPFSAFEKTSISESDKHIRQFLNLSYAQARSDNTITLQVDSLEDCAYFILRTHNESIDSIEGGSYTEIEENAYLIQVDQSEVQITLKNNNTLYYWYK